MEPTAIEELRVMSTFFGEAKLMAERGQDWDRALEMYEGDYELLGRHVGRACINNFSREGVVRTVHALAEQKPPIPSGDAEVFMGAAIMEYDELHPQLARMEV